MKWSLTRRFLLSIAPLFTFIGSASAVEIPPVPKLKTFYSEVKLTRNGQPNCLIAAPSGDEYAKLGQKLAEAIKKASGADVPVKDATTLPPKGDIAIPHTVKVVLPNGAFPYKADPKSVPARVASAKGKNFRDVAAISTSAAANYYLTGNPDDLEVFNGNSPTSSRTPT